MKRSFRPERLAAVSARYPTHVEGRRVFLQQLGLVIGGGVLASVLPGCGDEDGLGAWDTLGLPPDFAAPLDSPPVHELAGVSPDMPTARDVWPEADLRGPDRSPDTDLEPVHDLGVLQDAQAPGDGFPDAGVDLTDDQRG